jgi:hypothetical protein
MATARNSRPLIRFILPIRTPGSCSPGSSSRSLSSYVKIPAAVQSFTNGRLIGGHTHGIGGDASLLTEHLHPGDHGIGLAFGSLTLFDQRLRPFEHRMIAGNRNGPAFQVVDVQPLQNALRICVDLFTGPMIDLQPPRSSADVDTSTTQGNLQAMDALMTIAEETKGVTHTIKGTEHPNEPQGFEAKVLHLIDEHMLISGKASMFHCQAGLVDSPLKGQPVPLLRPRWKARNATQTWRRCSRLHRGRPERIVVR